METDMLTLVVDLREQLVRALREQEGQGLAEYALILFLVAIVAVVALTFLGVSITSILSSVAGSL
jgi:pilus assembly protein Flp/PilA